MLVFDAQTMQSRTINIGATTKTNITGIAAYKPTPLVSRDELKADLDSGSFLLIDVRSADEHAVVNIGGWNTTLTELEYQIKEIANGKQVVFNCASGKGSMQ